MASRAWVLLLRIILLTAILWPSASSHAQNSEPDELTKDYFSVLVTYACHARTLWHDASPGGYWGDGIDAKNQNGAVRGSVNTLYTYAVIVRGMDERLLTRRDIRLLRDADLTRPKLLEYIRKNMAYLAAHHKSAGNGLMPQWGYHWQSSLWMGALGTGALLVWDDLGPELKTNLIRVAAAEADWVASRKPKDGNDGDTGAEENAWDTHAPAVALAMAPEATSATLWWQTLRSFAANVYSRPHDLGRAASAPSGPLHDVTTTNIMDDFSLMNHGFFHPDYVQVSGQHLGEAWLILLLGDSLRGTNTAEAFEPYARFNVAPVWNQILRPLLLPTGEFAFPAGNDWTYHCSTNQGYFAYIATAFGDADAAEAERRGLQHVMNRREASPPGRLLGDSNLEWWWEPLVAKRCCAALLFHRAKTTAASAQAAAEPAPLDIDTMTTTVELTHAKVWFHRTPEYFASISWGNPQLGFFAPLGPGAEENPYMTLPARFSILPRGTTLTLHSISDTPSGTSGAVLRSDDRVIAGLACLPGSVVWLSLDGFGSLAIENDSLTLPGRAVEAENGVRHVFEALSKAKKAELPGRWVCIDGYLAMAADSTGFVYDPGCRWNMKSVAADKVRAPASTHAWQMAPGDAAHASALAENLTSNESSTSTVSATAMDPATRQKFHITLSTDGLNIQPSADK